MKEAITQRLGGRLQPVEIARKLAQAMDSNQTITAQRVLAPNLYTVYLNPSDLESLDPFRSTLEREMASFLSQAMEEAGLSSIARPRVMLMADDQTPKRKINVQARIVEGEAGAGESLDAGHTVKLQIPTSTGLAGRARFVSPAPEARGITYPVTHIPFTLGRALDNDVILEGRGISRHHAQVRAVHSRPFLVDLGSTNGTSVNGRSIREALLRDGDTIALGSIRLVFHWEQE